MEAKLKLCLGGWDDICLRAWRAILGTVVADVKDTCCVGRVVELLKVGEWIMTVIRGNLLNLLGNVDL